MRKRMLLAVLTCTLLCACSRTDNEAVTLSMGTFTEGSVMDTAGIALASAVNNSGAGIQVEVERSKGSPVNLQNLRDKDLDLAMVSGDAAYAAYTGTGTFEGEKNEGFRILAACYPVLSCWVTGNDELTYVHDLKGKVLSVGTEGSDTAEASAAVFQAMGIDENNTELWNYGISGGADGIRDGWADGIHGFSEMPVPSWNTLAGEQELTVLTYTEQELKEILENHPSWQKLTIPAGTYVGQEKAVDSFGVKVLLCTSADMDENMAYEIAKALDMNSAPFVSGHAFMKSMEEKEFYVMIYRLRSIPGQSAIIKNADISGK